MVIFVYLYILLKFTDNLPKKLAKSVDKFQIWYYNVDIKNKKGWYFTMKKIFALLSAGLIVASMLVACSDGKCDKCGEPAIKISAEEKKEAEEQGFKVDKELCEEHMAAYMLEQAAKMY